MPYFDNYFVGDREGFFVKQYKSLLVLKFNFLKVFDQKIVLIYIVTHCPKSNIVKRNVYLYSKKCLSGTEEMFLYCKSPC